MYVIVRTDQGGGYLAKQGSASSYTNKLQNARTFATRESAQRECCPDNEIVVSVSDIMSR